MVVVVAANCACLYDIFIIFRPKLLFFAVTPNTKTVRIIFGHAAFPWLLVCGLFSDFGLSRAKCHVDKTRGRCSAAAVRLATE